MTHSLIIGLLEAAVFSVDALRRMTPAVRVAKRIYTGSHHLDAVAEYVSTRVLKSWEKEAPDRSDLVQDWIEANWADLVDSGEGEEGFLLPDNGAFMTRLELFKKIPPTTRKRLGITGPEWVSSETFGIYND